MNNRKFVLIFLSIAIVVFGFILGQLTFPTFNILSKITPLNQAREIDAKCVEDLRAIRDAATVLQNRYSKLLSMGAIQEETKNYYTATSTNNLASIKSLSSNLKCSDRFALLVNLQIKILSTFEKIDVAYFYYSKDLEASHNNFIKTNDISSESYERWNFEKDMVYVLIDQATLLQNQYNDLLNKVRMK